MDGKTDKQRHELFLANIQTAMNVLFEIARMLKIKDGSVFIGKRRKKTIITVRMDATFATNMRLCTCTNAEKKWTIKFHPDTGIVIDVTEFDNKGKRINSQCEIEFTSPCGKTDEVIHSLLKLLGQVEKWKLS